jgi:hypothetical protein
VYEANLDREDFKAACHAQELRRKHLRGIAYAFLRSNRPCVYEAERTVQIVNSLGGAELIVGDAETGIREGKVRCFLREVERRGYPAREYTCPGCGDEQAGPVWIASYPTRPAGRWIAHQFSSTFLCRGVFGDCSVDEGILSIRRHPAPSPSRERAAKRRSLAGHKHLRTVLHGNIERHHCRQHATPRSYHTVCGRWLHEGDRAISVIHQLERELHGTSR